MSPRGVEIESIRLHIQRRERMYVLIYTAALKKVTLIIQKNHYSKYMCRYNYLRRVVSYGLASIFYISRLPNV